MDGRREKLKLSVVIPSHDEEDSIESTVTALTAALSEEKIDYEIIVVDDNSVDNTVDAVARLHAVDARVHRVQSPYRSGYGFAVRAGLERYSGDAVAIVMADGSDSPRDLIAYHRLLEDGYSCAFGSRFIAGGRTYGYPLPKLLLNRAANFAVRLAFGHDYNDTTNAFKAYRREVIDDIQPLISHHFNLTVEMPLKAIVRGHSYAVTPISWTNRTAGVSKLHVKEMGSRYLFILLYVYFEHHLSRGDYRSGAPTGQHWRAGVPGRPATEGSIAAADGEPVDPRAS